MEAVGCEGIWAWGEVAPGAVPVGMGFVGSMVGMVVGEFGIGVGRVGDGVVGVPVLGVCRIGDKCGVCMVKRLGVSGD